VTVAEVALLVGSALAVFASGALAVATLVGKGQRVPQPWQFAVANAATMGKWHRRGALGIALFFCAISQCVLVLYLASSSLSMLGVLLVIIEFVLAVLIVRYLFSQPRDRA
jgi:hypothetical protein